MNYEVLDISGDVGIKAYGNTCEDVFANAGIGMYSLITGIEGIEEKKDLAIETTADTLEGLMVNYLNELVFHFDTYGFIGREIRDVSLIKIGTHPNYELKANVYGEDFDSHRHARRLLIKAATYHKIRVEKKGESWESDVIFDI